MNIKNILLAIMVLCISQTASATKWFAGSSYVGDVIVKIEGMPDSKSDSGAHNAVVWHCNGQRCELDGPWGGDLSLISCRNLVKKVGKVTYYGNNQGKLWSPVSGREMLNRCNRGY